MSADASSSAASARGGAATPAPEASAAAAQRSPTHPVALPLSRSNSRQASLDTPARSASHDSPPARLAPTIKPRISSIARSPSSSSHSLSDDAKEVHLPQAASDDKLPIMDASLRQGSIDTSNLSTLSITLDSSSPDHSRTTRYVNLVCPALPSPATSRQSSLTSLLAPLFPGHDQTTFPHSRRSKGQSTWYTRHLWHPRVASGLGNQHEWLHHGYLRGEQLLH